MNGVPKIKPAEGKAWKRLDFVKRKKSWIINDKVILHENYIDEIKIDLKSKI